MQTQINQALEDNVLGDRANGLSTLGVRFHSLLIHTHDLIPNQNTTRCRGRQNFFHFEICYRMPWFTNASV